MTDAAHDIVGGKCSACQNVVFEWPYNDGPPKTISPSLERIYEQPGSGCSFCQVLSYFLKRQVDIVEDTFRINRLRRATPPHLIFTFKSSDNNDHVRDWELFTLPEADSPGLFSGDISSPSTLEVARGWLETCVSHHLDYDIRSKPLKAPPKLPRRILDTTPLDNHGSIKLLETTNEHANYVCLSHCWGTENRPLVTTGSNIEQWKRKIQWRLLPRTFQDAIDFVRRLEQRYLWIDSLCILQDNRTDWDEHAVNMADIFRNSYITLGAAWGSDCTSGLYQKDPDYLATSYSTVFSCGKRYTSYYRQVSWKPGSTTFYHYHGMVGSIHKDPDNAILHSRGWVLQERLLSPRWIDFRRAGFFWACCETLWSEDEKLYNEKLSPINIKSPIAIQSISKTDFAAQQAKATQYLWRQLVQRYSALHLTNREDKLQAIQGIARIMPYSQGQRILSGLSEADLVRDMCWISINPPLKPSGWIAPSWSWACTDSLIEYGAEISYQEHADILSVQVDEKTEDGRAIVSAHSLTMSVPLISGFIKYYDPHKVNHPPLFVPQDVNGKDKDAVHRLAFYPDEFNEYEDLNEGNSKSDTFVFCGLLLTYDRGFGFAIILLLAEKDGQFYRIGCCKEPIRTEFPVSKLGSMFDGIGKTIITLI